MSTPDQPTLGHLLYRAARQLLRGPRLERHEWLLLVPRIQPRPTDYRDAPVPTVADLVERLERLGYRLAVSSADVRSKRAHSLDLRSPLAGSAFTLRDRRLGPDDSWVTVRVSQLTGERPGMGFVEARDRRGRGYEELALFLISELATVVPGLAYKPASSALSADPAERLLLVLPDRPESLSS